MKVSIDWLKGYVDIDVSVDELADKLTNIGFNLEEIIEHEGDVILDLEITSNRPDCLGHIGVAREISAILNKPLKMPVVELTEDISVKVEQMASVCVLTPELCPRYTARVIKGVQVGPSPDWLVRRLEAVGLRSVNNVVDITNYVLLETSQPLHAFDLGKLSGCEINVRKAQKGEKFIAIDHSEHELSNDDLIIADADRPVAIAGVMGGLETEVTETTKDILLESAQFNPITVRRTARKLNLHSESSFRFERKVDPVNVEFASRRAAQLICEIAGGTLASGIIDIWQNPFVPTELEFDCQLVKRVLGISVSVEQCEAILKSLGLTIKSQNNQNKDVLKLVIPSHRSDLSRPIDIVEEIGRIVGLDKIPTSERISVTTRPTPSTEKIVRAAHYALNHCGYYETITVTLVDPKHATMFTDIENVNALKIDATQRMSNNALRCSLIPSLLAVRKTNQDAGNSVSDIYELARIYLPRQSDMLPEEQLHLAMLSSSADIRSIRGALELLCKMINSPKEITLKPEPNRYFLPDQSAKLFLGDDEIGIIGTINTNIQKQFDLKKPVAVAELNFDYFLKLEISAPLFAPLPRYPGIKRDFSVIVDEKVKWDEISRAIENLHIADMQQIEFGEMFRGKQIPKGQKSLFFSVLFRNPSHSLTHEQADEYQREIITLLEKTFNAKLRMQ